MASMTVALSPPSSWISSSLYANHTPSPSLFFRNASSLGLSSKSPPFSCLSQGWRRSVSAAAVAAAEGPVVESLDAPDAASEEGGSSAATVEAEAAENRIDIPKGEDIFAVVMVGSRQYIVFPGRYIYTQRLKGANVNDKIVLNKVLLVGTKTSAYIGKPVVTNAAVHAVVEEQGLNKKVIVFKYKKRKNYRRNIGHRQPNTRLKITGITGYEDYPVSTLST